MTKGLNLLRTALLLVAVLAYALNGASAGVAKAGDGTVLIPICSSEGTRYVSLEVSGDAPADMPETKCGDCLLAAAIMPNAVSLTKPVAAFAAAPFALPAQALPDRSPIWPGAPPTGPPLTL